MKESRVRVPAHIQDIARRIVTLTMHVQSSSQRLDEELASLDARRTELMTMLENLKTHEAELDRECQEWLADRKK